VAGWACGWWKNRLKTTQLEDREVDVKATLKTSLGRYIMRFGGG